MNHPDSTEHWVQRAEELVSWTGREQLRLLGYRLCLTISEMNYASRRLVELQIALPSTWPTAPPAASKIPRLRHGTPHDGEALVEGEGQG